MERLPDKDLLNKSAPLEKAPLFRFVVRWRLRGSRLFIPLQEPYALVEIIAPGRNATPNAVN